MSCTVSRSKQGYKHFANVYVVRGVGKRAIHVVVQPFPAVQVQLSGEELAVKAAVYAARQGWKRCVVAPDMVYGEDAHVFNLHQYRVDVWARGFLGAYLCSSESKWGGDGFKTSRREFYAALPDTRY